MQQTVASIISAQHLMEEAALLVPVNGGVKLEGATPPGRELIVSENQVEQESTCLRSPRRVRFDTGADNENSHWTFPKEIALDRLTAFEINTRQQSVHPHTSSRTLAQWAHDILSNCEKEKGGEVGAVAASAA